MKKIKEFKAKEVGGSRGNSIVFAVEGDKFIIYTRRGGSVVSRFNFPKEKIQDVMTATVDTLVSLSDLGGSGGGIDRKTASQVVINSFKNFSRDDKGWILSELIKDYAGVDKIKDLGDLIKCKSASMYALWDKNMLKAFNKYFGWEE